MVPPMAVLWPPRFSQFADLRSALNCNWYRCPWTALQVKTSAVLDLVADWNDGGKSTAKRAPSLVAGLRALVTTTEYVPASPKVTFERVRIRWVEPRMLAPSVRLVPLRRYW